MSKDQFRLMKVAKDAWVHSCDRCGCIVYERSVHEAWHATNDRYEDCFMDIIVNVLKKMAEEDAEKTSTIVERTTNKEE